MSNIKEIAEKAGVSRTTVSRVLNDSGYVSEKVRERVLAVIKETGYVPSENAKALRTKKTKVIGVILPKISTETSSRLVKGMDQVLAKEGYQILLAASNLSKEKEIEYLSLLKSRNVDGIIFSATTVHDKLAEEINKLSIPLVVVGQKMPNAISLVFDECQVSKDMVSVLIKKGHKKIAFIGVSEEDQAVGFLRKKGFMEAMKENKLPIEESWIQTGVFNVESGYQAMGKIINESENRPTAVIAVTDRLAIGAINCLKTIGLSVPGDVAVAGMGSSEMSQYISPPLSTVDFQYEQLGNKAAQIILQKIKGSEQKEKIVKINYRLIMRDSL